MVDKQVQEFFNQESDTYKEGLKEGSQEKLSFLSENGTKNSKLLDIGCGSGAFLEGVHGHTPIKDVVGIDIASEMLSYTKHRSGDFAIANARMLPFKDSSFDFVHADTVIHHIVGETQEKSRQYVEQLFKDVNRILTNNGYFLITERIQKARLISDELLSQIIFTVLRDAAVLARPFYRNTRFQQSPINFYSEERLFNNLLDTGYAIFGVDRFIYDDFSLIRSLVQKESHRLNIYAAANAQSW